MPCPASTGLLVQELLLRELLFESSEPKTHHVGGVAMAFSKWVLLFLVMSITAGLSIVANRSSVSADVAGALFDTLLIIFVVLLVLGFSVYRPA
jgi:uncharacterized membrane protein YtjA (UPF0391 family)